MRRYGGRIFELNFSAAFAGRVADPRLADHPGRDQASGAVAVADELAMAVVIDVVLVGVDAVGNLRIDWLGQELLGPAPDDFGGVEILEGETAWCN